jgi:gliding motility-associated-like protein
MKIFSTCIVFLGILSSVFSQSWNMNVNQTINISTCSGIIYDAGGSAGNYSNNEASTLVICSGNPSMGVTVTFTSFSTQLNSDFLHIYSGNGVAGSHLATLTGTSLPNPVSYSSSSPCITLYFVSNNSTTAAGFSALVKCTPIPTCSDGIQNGLETGIDCGGCNSCPPCTPTSQVSSSSSSSSANIYNLPCGGGSVNLAALGQNTLPVLSSNFNNGTPGVGWDFVGSGMFNNPCGPSPNGSTHIWFGNASPHPRSLTTSQLKLPCGGSICFDLKYAVQGGTGSCEGPDLPNEGVSLMYSTDCGLTFSTIAYFHPNGTVTASNPMTISPGINGNTNFTTWKNYCFTLPAGAFTDHTILRWHQEGTSGAPFDHWGIDEVVINANNCNPYYFDWAHIAGFPDPANTTVNVTTTTTYDVIYTNGVNDTIPSQVTVVVTDLPAPAVTVTNESCLGYSNGSVIIDNPGGNGPFNLTLTGPLNGTYTEGNGAPDFAIFDNLPPGIYAYTVLGKVGCIFTGTFTVLPGTLSPTVSVSPSSAHVCFGEPNQLITASPIGGIAPYTYLWNTGATTQSITIGAGIYTVTINDSKGCGSTTESTTITKDVLPILANAGLDINQCAQTSSALNLNGTIQTASGAKWIGGAGTFNPSNTSLSTLYSPTSGEINNGAVDLSLVSTGNLGCPADTDIVRLNFLFFNETMALSLNHISCFGASDGSAHLNVVGTFSPAAFSWDNGPISATNSVLNLAPGTHQVQIINSLGCDTNLVFNINEPTQLTASISPTSAHLCFGSPLQTIASTVSGGTAPYDYSWNTGEITPSIVKGAGTYTLTLSDINHCGPLLVSATITQDSQPIEANAGGDINQCAKSAGPINITGSVQTATGGIWSGGNGSFAPNNTSLNATYTPSASDISNGFVNLSLITTGNNNCPADTDIVQLNFLHFTELTLLTTKNSTCFGYNNGEAHLLVTGLLSPSSFSWDNGPITDVPDKLNLVSGVHEVLIMNSMGCDTTLNYIINEPGLLAADLVAITDVRCAGEASGKGIVLGENGIPPFSYTWNTVPAQTGSVANNLTAGSYICEIRDLNNCITDVPVVVNEPAPLAITLSGTSPTCNGFSNGSIVSTVTGGIPSYIYKWSNDVLSSTLNNIQGGNYALHVTDKNGCLLSDSIQLIEPIAFSGTITNDTVICPGALMNIVVSASGGTGVLSYNWAPVSGSTNSINVSPTTQDTYTCVVSDQNGCNSTFETTVSVNNLYSNEIVATVNKNIICEKELVYLSAQYLGNNSSMELSWLHCPLCPTNIPLTAKPLSDTFFIIQATNTCLNTVWDTVYIKVNPLPIINITPASTIICQGESVQFINAADNSSNWLYLWDFGNGEGSSMVSPVYSYPKEGNYLISLSITDNFGCKGVTENETYTTVNPRANANYSISSLNKTMFDPLFNFTNFSSNATNYIWDFGDSQTSTIPSPDHTYETDGEYIIKLVANNQYNCPDSIDKMVVVKPSWAIYTPNTFTPGNDNLNNIFRVEGYGILEANFQFEIYNRWGEKVFVSYDLNYGWDGRLINKDNVIQDGIYIWVAYYQDITGKKHRSEGHVSILK